LQGLDFLLAEMDKRKMYAVIFLNNYWVWSGGMAQYVAWNEGVSVPSPFKEPYDWDAFMRFSARFYTYENANRQFLQYVKTLINRINIFTGQKYKDDPTIMSWQLANEPRPGGGDWGTANFGFFANGLPRRLTILNRLIPIIWFRPGTRGWADQCGHRNYISISIELKILTT
jgi:mannan endo-1,4-beta-mannosidase